jgi:RNA polymerase sigma-70 factor, ECF subfamily
VFHSTSNISSQYPKPHVDAGRIFCLINRGRVSLRSASQTTIPPRKTKGRKYRNGPSNQKWRCVLTDPEISSEILEACRHGDRDAFRKLYELYKDKVYSIALYFFHGDPAAAADVTQQVFLKLMTTIHQFRGDAGFSTWLYRLVVNTCTDGARKSKAQALNLDRPGHDLRARAGSQEDHLARAQMASSVQSAVSTLPPKFRIAILLRYFEDLSYEEMARVLNCSMGTVASRLNRGHRILADKLAPLKRWLVTGDADVR